MMKKLLVFLLFSSVLIDPASAGSSSGTLTLKSKVQKSVQINYKFRSRTRDFYFYDLYLAGNQGADDAYYITLQNTEAHRTLMLRANETKKNLKVPTDKKNSPITIAIVAN